MNMYLLSLAKHVYFQLHAHKIEMYKKYLRNVGRDWIKLDKTTM